MTAPRHFPASTQRAAAEDWMRQFQDWLCHRLEAADGSGVRFTGTDWAHEGGGGNTRTLQNGDVIEKGRVAFSAAWGALPPAATPALLLPNTPYFATGVAVEQHPHSPHVPVSHLNVCYVEADTGEAWFGGSLDLAPLYVEEAQARWFHEQLLEVCQRHDPGYYLRFKAGADAPFYLPHCPETRGIGGLYFERLTVGRDGLFEELFAFVQDVGQVYGRTTTTLMRQNAHLPYADRAKP